MVTTLRSAQPQPSLKRSAKHVRQLLYKLSRVVIPTCVLSESSEPVYGGTRKFQEDPHWRDVVLFYEYFHGDNGTGLGASHQTGWTGLVARAMQMFATRSDAGFLERGTIASVGSR